MSVRLAFRGESITVNGIEDEAGDPFIIKQGPQSFGTVKTAKKDYDEVRDYLSSMQQAYGDIRSLSLSCSV